MCGISAVVLYNHRKDASEYIKQLLTLQEYRGSSSSGVAFVSQGKVKVLKSLDRPSVFAKKLKIKSFAFIGHGRAPSVGSVKIENAQPFLSCKGFGPRFALAHNGTISNHHILKIALQYKHEFQGETDSETVMHFVEEHLGLVKQIVKSFGYSRFLLLFPDKLIGTGDNLYISRDRNGIYVAQDINVFQEMFNGERRTIYMPSDGSYFEFHFYSQKLYLENYSKKRLRLTSRPVEKIKGLYEWSDMGGYYVPTRR